MVASASESNSSRRKEPLHCVCFNFRRAARAVTQRFDQALAPSGLKSTQFTVLIAVAGHEPVTMTHLADALAMDRTTLTRNLRPLEKSAYLSTRSGDDRRTREIVLTDAGRAVLRRAMPLWRAAQTEVVDRIGEDDWRRMRSDIEKVMEAARA